MFSASVDYLKVALWKQNAPIENLGLQTPLVCFADSWKVMRLLFPPPFTPGMHPLQIKSFYFGKMGNFVVRTIHIEMSFQCLVKHFHFLICSSTSFQVGICSFFVSVHCKKAQQAPKAHPLLESSDLSQIYQEPFAITARAVTVLLMGEVGSPLQHWSLGFCNQNPC